jgi:hypothetical protein
MTKELLSYSGSGSALFPEEEGRVMDRRQSHGLDRHFVAGVGNTTGGTLFEFESRDKAEKTAAKTASYLFVRVL